MIGVGDGHGILKRAGSHEGGGHFRIRLHVCGWNENGLCTPSFELPGDLGKFDVVADRHTDMLACKLDDGQLFASGKERRLLFSKQLALSVNADLFTAQSR